MFIDSKYLLVCSEKLLEILLLFLALRILDSDCFCHFGAAEDCKVYKIRQRKVFLLTGISKKSVHLLGYIQMEGLF